MPTSQQGQELYLAAFELAQDNNQLVGEKNEYFVTLAQLEALIREKCRVL